MFPPGVRAQKPTFAQRQPTWAVTEGGLSGGDLFLEANSGRHGAALRASPFVARKIAAIGVSFDSNLRRLAAAWANIIHEQIKRHGAYLCASALDCYFVRHFLGPHWASRPYARALRRYAYVRSGPLQSCFISSGITSGELSAHLLKHVNRGLIRDAGRLHRRFKVRA
jgi:hypothetical protein